MKKLTWFHELGFFNNPFSIKPAAFHNELMGYNQTIKQINKKIEDSNIIFISGDYGTGKTTVLKKIINEFKGKKRVIYYNCNQSDKSIDFDELLTNVSWWRKLLGVRKKNMIILLDEAQDMNKKDLEQINAYYDEGFFKSVIFVSKEEDMKLTKELEELTGKNKFRIGNVDKTEAVKIIRKRIGNLKFISDQNIIMIFNKNKNPRSFLKNCEDVCRNAFENGSKKATEGHIKKVLG